MRKRNISSYIPVIGFASAIVGLITVIIVLINTCNSRSNTPPSNSQSSSLPPVSPNVEVTVNPVISPVIVNDIKIYPPESQPSSHEVKTSGVPEIVQVTPPSPSSESEYRKIYVPKIMGDKSSESAFGRNVRIDLMQIDYKNQALGIITVSGYEQREFALDKHSLPVEIGRYNIMVVDTGKDYAEFCITRKE